MRKKKPARPATASKPRASEGGGLLVAVELGAAWPELVNSESTAVRRVLCQRDGEAPAAFAERIGSSLEGLFGRGVALAGVTLACNERADDAAQDARRKLAGLALGSMAKAKVGGVTLAAGSRSSGRVRGALSSLAHALREEWRSAGLEVTVDFGERASATPAPVFTFTARVA